MRSVYRRYVMNTALVATALCLNGQPLGAFTQAGGTSFLGYKTPTGHEYITVRAAKMAMDEEAEELKKPNRQDKASVVLNQLQDSSLKGAIPSGSNYDAPYHNVWAAVMGQRFVDNGGFTVILESSRTCWDAITQMQEEGQADHFLRRHSKEDEGVVGGRNAIERSKARFREVFLEAVFSDDRLIDFYDGGATTDAFAANKAYFLFGRAVHLLEDSFSPEHGKRNPAMDYYTIMDIKSYVCTLQSAQHTHEKPWNSAKGHGDIIWKDTSAAKEWKNLNPEAQAAVKATAHLWQLFAIAHADRQNRPMAEGLIDSFINLWMKIDPDAPLHDTKQDNEQAACEKAIKWQAASYDNVRACLEKIEPKVTLSKRPKDRPVSDYIDMHMLLPYSWVWTDNKKVIVHGPA